MEILALKRPSETAQIDQQILQYSMLKLGQARSVENHARDLGRQIRITAPDLMENPDDWVLVYPGTGDDAIPNAITFVARRVASELGVACAGLGKKDADRSDYASASKAAREQGRQIVLMADDLNKVAGRNIVLVDDSIASGTAIEKCRRLLETHGTLRHCMVLADFRAAGDPAYERKANRMVIELMGSDIFTLLLNNYSNYITSKLIHYLYEDGEQLTSVLPELKIPAVATLILATQVYYREAAAPHLNAIRRHLTDSSDSGNSGIQARLLQVVESFLSGVEAGSTATTDLSSALSRHHAYRLCSDSFEQTLSKVFPLDTAMPA